MSPSEPKTSSVRQLPAPGFRCPPGPFFIRRRLPHLQVLGSVPDDDPQAWSVRTAVAASARSGPFETAWMMPKLRRAMVSTLRAVADRRTHAPRLPGRDSHRGPESPAAHQRGPKCGGDSRPYLLFRRGRWRFGNRYSGSSSSPRSVRLACCRSVSLPQISIRPAFFPFAARGSRTSNATACRC